jgi:peroxiredoxin
MRHLTTFVLTATLALAGNPASLDASRVGEPAPAFTATDSKGKAHNLSDFKGKWVVLEWHNNGCPYVKKHYEGGNMQKLQKEWTANGVVWLTVISSAQGQQGHLTGPDADAYAAKIGASPTAILLDAPGTLGRAYDAKTTPHMFVINPQGQLVYNGAIDDKPTTDQADLAPAANYVSAALKAGMAGTPIATATTRPYGCGIKYGK